MKTNRKKRRTRAEVLHDRRLREVRAALRRGELPRLLSEYVRSCYEDGAGQEAREPSDGRRGAARHMSRIPNPAGFCRYLGLEAGAYDRLAREYPTEVGRLRAIFLDEAFNASLSPSVLSLYLKFFFGAEEDGENGGEALTVTFEHDILADGR